MKGNMVGSKLLCDSDHIFALAEVTHYLRREKSRCFDRRATETHASDHT